MVTRLVRENTVLDKKCGILLIKCNIELILWIIKDKLGDFLITYLIK